VHLVGFTIENVWRSEGMAPAFLILDISCRKRMWLTPRTLHSWWNISLLDSRLDGPESRFEFCAQDRNLCPCM